MIRLSDISLPPEHSAHQLPFEAARMLRIPNSKIRGVRIVRRRVDARKKPNVRIIYTIDLTVDGSEKKILKQSGCKRASIAPATRYKPSKSACSPEKRPVVVGFGPGGMFAALILALAGWKPLVLERGEDAESRHEKVEKFFQTGRAGHEKQRPVRRGRRGNVFRRQAEHRGQQPQNRLDSGTVCGGGGKGGHSL